MLERSAVRGDWQRFAAIRSDSQRFIKTRAHDIATAADL